MTTVLSVCFQAFYQRRQDDGVIRVRFQEEIVLGLVGTIRRRQPRCGTRKLLYLLREDLKRLDYRLGRDALLSLLRREELLIRPRKRRAFTTQSAHSQPVYPNLIECFEVRRVGALLVSDITYLRLAEGFCYLFLVTDICSRMVVGWELSLTLDASGALSALRTALRTVPLVRRSIHHSDRGVQYCSAMYVMQLQRVHFRISMGRVGCPQDNAVAERINGILKGEFFLDRVFDSFALAHRATADTINIYNNERPHLSLDMLTPREQFCKTLGRRSSSSRSSFLRFSQNSSSVLNNIRRSIVVR